ncbi:MULTISPECIES: GGDEF domain-containing protein [unclassified Thalassospira]|jgi:GGDEF domain-containing protein|uniref:GGDEF domain-containing protein n=1 Tax=unclassified Thalassospira TaxID=2648997 RepID=UPI000A1E5D9F|nr:GGDEF domain-containing protein [Thalassospira sp. MCCC 1A01428]
MKVTEARMASSSFGAGSEGRNPAAQQAVHATQAYGRATPGGREESYSLSDSLDGRDGNKGGSGSDGSSSGGGQGNNAGRTPMDPANLLGIPSEQITPAVERALSRLMTRVDTLVTQLETVQKHQQELARRSSQDPFTGLLSRPSFMQILENEISVSPPPVSPRCLLLCEIADLENLSKTYGQSCKDAMIAQLAEFLTVYIQPPHQLGYLGCNDFAALLYNVDAAEGWRRSQAIGEQLQRASYFWDGQLVDYRLVFGVYQIGPGESVTTVMGGVDRELRWSMAQFSGNHLPE